MATAKITKALLDELEPPVGRRHRVVWDTSPGMTGFGVRVTAAGTVSFIVRYYSPVKRADQWATLGQYPGLTLTKARERAVAMLRAAAEGRDPVEEEREALVERQDEAREGEGHTVAALAAEWLTVLPTKRTRRGKTISPRTVEQYKGAIERDILPELGGRAVTAITRADVAALHRQVTKRGRYAANRTVNVLSVFYRWLESIEAVPAGTNPARQAGDILNPEQRRGEHVSVRLSRDQEARLVAAIEDLRDGFKLKGRKHSDPIGAAALLTLLDTGRRKGEVLRLEWARLDLEAGTADLGATKGKSAGTDVCFLSERAREAIRRLPRIVGCPYVFTGAGKGGRRAGLQSAWEIVKERAGLREISQDLEGFHLHDLRHHRISELLAAGIAPQLVARQVGHTSLDQLRVYSHLEVADVAAVMGRLAPVEASRGGEVVELREATK